VTTVVFAPVAVFDDKHSNCEELMCAFRSARLPDNARVIVVAI